MNRNISAMGKENCNSFAPSSMLWARQIPLIFAFLSDGCQQHTNFKLESFLKLTFAVFLPLYNWRNLCFWRTVQQ
jgi:hypothetical protein